jgi:hypothetical protein
MSRSGEIGRHATFRALCSKGHGGSSPPFGTPRLSTSTDVFQPLHRLIEFLPLSTEIYCCLPVLLSEAMRKRQGAGRFRRPADEENGGTSAFVVLSKRGMCVKFQPFLPMAHSILV